MADARDQDPLAVIRGRKSAHTAQPALGALALVGVLAALSARPVYRTAQLGTPDAAISCLPSGELPVPDRPERPEIPSPAAIVTSVGLPLLAPAIALTSSCDTGGPHDGFRPRVERPPIG